MSAGRRYREQVAAAIRAVTIRGPTQYAWLGRRGRPLPAPVGAELGPSECRDHLVACLREELYWSFYCHGGPVAARWGEPEPFTADLRLVEELSQANAGRGSWEPGWTVARLEGDEAVVSGSRLRIRVSIARCRTSAGTLAPGAEVSLRLPSELPSLSPGFFTVLSDAPADLGAADCVVRVYWNVARAGAPALVGALTTRLNAARVPFRLKVADHPFRLDRCDAAVLYVAGEDFPGLRGMLLTLAERLRPALLPSIPAFTLELTPGVGLAEDGAAAASFGERRCGLLADGIVRAHGLTREDARVAEVAACFAEAGVSIDAPYLEPLLAGRHVL